MVSMRNLRYVTGVPADQITGVGLNPVERFSALITRQIIRRDAFTNVINLEGAAVGQPAHHDTDLKPLAGQL
jgi:hypothetical protein